MRLCHAGGKGPFHAASAPEDFGEQHVLLSPVAAARWVPRMWTGARAARMGTLPLSPSPLDWSTSRGAPTSCKGATGGLGLPPQR